MPVRIEVILKKAKRADKTKSFSRIKYNLPTEYKLIGDKIINKPPSAELGPNQLDTDSLPPYSKLDIILKEIIKILQGYTLKGG